MKHVFSLQFELSQTLFKVNTQKGTLVSVLLICWFEISIQTMFLNWSPSWMNTKWCSCQVQTKGLVTYILYRYTVVLNSVIGYFCFCLIMATINKLIIPYIYIKWIYVVQVIGVQQVVVSSRQSYPGVPNAAVTYALPVKLSYWHAK